MSIAEAFREKINQSTYLIFQFLSSLPVESRNNTKIISYLKKTDDYCRSIVSFKKIADANSYSYSVLEQCKNETKEASDELFKLFIGEASSFLTKDQKNEGKSKEISEIIEIVKQSFNDDGNEFVHAFEFKGNVLEKVNNIFLQLYELDTNTEENFDEKDDNVTSRSLPSNAYDPDPLPEELPQSMNRDNPRWYESNSTNESKNNESRIAELEKQLAESQEENRILKEKLRKLNSMILEARALIRK